MRISKNEKGITLIALTITIIVLMIVTSITVVNMESSMKVRKVDKLYNDISNLQTKIDTYYVEYKELPILEQYCESQDELKSILELNGVSDVQLDKNDDEYYYVIDLSKFDGLTLSYGKEFDSDLSTDKGKKDLYIVNNRSHQIYYPKTISFNKKYYYSYLNSDKTITIGDISSVNGDITINAEKNINMNYSILTGTKVKLMVNVTISDEGKENCKYQFAWSNNSESANNYKDFPNVTDGSDGISLESEKLGGGQYWLYIKRINEVGNEEIKKVKFNNEGDDILPIVIEEKSIVLSVLNYNQKVGVKISYNNVQIEDLKYGTGNSLEEAQNNLKKFSKDLIDENSDESITEYNIMEEDGIDLTKYLYVQGKEKDKDNITSAYIYILQESNSVESEVSMYNCLNTEIVDGKIYGNSTQNGEPSPDSPVEIESVGDKSTNLFDMDSILPEQGWSKQEDGSYYIENNKSVYKKKLWENTEGYTGQIKIDYQAKYLKDNSESIAAGTTIGVVYTDGTMEGVVFNNNKWTKDWRSADCSNVSNASKTVDYVMWKYGTGDNSTWVKDIMITKDTSSTEYEPYGKYKIPITVSGKNILKYPYYNTTKTTNGITFTDNGDGTITANGTATANVTFYIDNTYLFNALDKTKIYTLSSNYIYGKDYVLLNLYKENKFVKELGTWEKGTRILDLSNYDYDKIECYIFVKSGETLNNFVFNPQIEEGDKATSYEQYKEPVTYNIYLDEPLRKVGDYADYIDLKNKKVVRKVVEKKYNGTESWRITGETTLPEGYTSFVLSDTTVLPRYGKNIKVTPISNKLECYAGGSAGIKEKKEILVVDKDSYYSIRPRILISRLSENTEEAWKSWLTENPITVDYALDTPTEENITISDIILSAGVQMLKVNTKIAPSYIECKYLSNIE